MEGDQEGVRFEPGSIIDDKFQVRRLLGQGAMGAVIEALHLLRRAPVALKFMSPEMMSLPGVVERFLNEGVAASRINSEHVVKVLDVSKLPNGQPYLVMEFLEGEDLAALLEREGESGLADVGRGIYMVLQILRGLQMAHQVGIIHRDLKPANCFVVSHDGAADFIKLVDFGISKVQDPDDAMHLTQEGSSMGTPLYVSPEQARDATKADARSDIYSVSAMFYEMLCGRLPIEPESIADLYMKLAIQIPASLDSLRGDLPPGLADVVARGLAKAPDDRFQSATEMAQALAPYADERSDIVLRQITHRGSNRSSRAPSAAPPRGSVPPPSSVAYFQTVPDNLRAMTSVAPTPSLAAVRGTLKPVVSTEQVAAATITVRGRPALMPWGIGLLLLVLAAGASAFFLRQRAASEVAEQAASSPSAVEPKRPAATPEPVAKETEVPPPSETTQSQAESKKVGASGPTTEPPPRVRPVGTPGKTSLKKIEIQD